LKVHFPTAVVDEIFTQSAVDNHGGYHIPVPVYMKNVNTLLFDPHYSEEALKGSRQESPTDILSRHWHPGPA